MKKLIALILALVMVVGLCACGDNSSAEARIGYSYLSQGHQTIIDLNNEADLYYVVIQNDYRFDWTSPPGNVAFTFTTDKETFERIKVGETLDFRIKYSTLKEHKTAIITTEYGGFPLTNVPKMMMGIFDSEYCVEYYTSESQVLIHVRDVNNELINFDIIATPELVNELEVGEVFKGTLNVDNHLLNNPEVVYLENTWSKFTLVNWTGI